MKNPLSGASPNVLIIGAVSGFGLYLLWKWTSGDSSQGGGWRDDVAEGVAGQVLQNNRAADTVGESLPFSPWWWKKQIESVWESIPETMRIEN